MSEHWLRRFQFYCAASEGSFHFLHAEKIRVHLWICTCTLCCLSELPVNKIIQLASQQASNQQPFTHLLTDSGGQLEEFFYLPLIIHGLIILT